MSMRQDLAEISAAVDELLARLEACERDAERMNWLEEREAASVDDFKGTTLINDEDGHGIRAAIDSAMQGERT